MAKTAKGLAIIVLPSKYEAGSLRQLTEVRFRATAAMKNSMGTMANILNFILVDA